MPLQDFLTGALLFALVLLATGAATGLIVRARLAHLDALERALAAIVTGTAILVSIHLVPLLLGVLSRASVLVAAAVAVALATRVRPVPAQEPPEDRGPPPPPSGRFEWVVAGIAAAVVAVAALADLGRWAGDELVGVDPLTFHLPNIGRWIQSGSLWQIDQFVPQLAHGNYPNNGDVVMLSTVLPWHNDFLVRAPIVFFLAGHGGRRGRARPRAARPVPAAVLAARGRRVDPDRRHRDDPARAARLAAVGDLRLRRAVSPAPRAHRPHVGPHARRHRPRDRVRDEVVRDQLGRRAGRRLDRRAPAAPRARTRCARALLVGGLALLGDAAWLARNLVESANPVFPVKIAPFGVTIFDAPRDEIVEAVGFSILDYLGDPPVLRQLAGEVFDGLGLLAIACAVALVAAAILSRRAPDPRVVLLAVAAIALVPVYMWLPGTALGNPGDPSLASVNTRYAVPILMLLAAGRGVDDRAPAATALAGPAARAARRRRDRRVQGLRGHGRPRRRPRGARARAARRRRAGPCGARAPTGRCSSPRRRSPPS